MFPITFIIFIKFSLKLKINAYLLLILCWNTFQIFYTFFIFNLLNNLTNIPILKFRNTNLILPPPPKICQIIRLEFVKKFNQICRTTIKKETSLSNFSNETRISEAACAVATISKVILYSYSYKNTFKIEMTLHSSSSDRIHWWILSPENLRP